MLEGLAAHSLCLEPQKFEDDFLYWKTDKRRQQATSNGI